MGKKVNHRESGYYEIRRPSPVEGALSEKAFPVTVITGNVIYNALHWHDHAEILYCMFGGFCVRVEERVFRMAAGDILFINGRDSHEIFDGTRDGLQVIVSIDPGGIRNPDMRYFCQTVGEWAAEGAADKTAGKMLQKKDERAAGLRKLMGRLAYYMTPDSPEEIYGELPASDRDWYGYLACCYQLLQILSDFQTGEQTCGVQDKNEDFRRCISYIHDHYQEELGIGKLAGVMNVSEPTLYRVFQNKLAVTPTAYIHIVRIRMACAMLKDPARKVADVAFECGFTSLSNFYRTFEKYMKISPREYRKRNTVTGAGRPPVSYQGIMDANIFQNFYELPYEREVFLSTWDDAMKS